MQKEEVFPTAEEVEVVTQTKILKYPFLTHKNAQDLALWELLQIKEKSIVRVPENAPEHYHR